MDRALRIVAGLLLVALAAKGTLDVWGYLGVVGLPTGLVGNCPLYAMSGFATRARPADIRSPRSSR